MLIERTIMKSGFVGLRVADAGAVEGHHVTDEGTIVTIFPADPEDVVLQTARRKAAEWVKPRAVFAIGRLPSGMIAGTATQGSKMIGLPGGKVMPSENPIDALLRECAEGGWEVRVSPRGVLPIYIDRVEGCLTYWYAVDVVQCILGRTEAGRIEPVEATMASVALYDPAYARALDWWGDEFPDVETLPNGHTVRTNPLTGEIL